MKPLISTQSQIRAFNQNAIRLFRQMILADAIIADSELKYLELYARPYDPETATADGYECFRFGFMPEDFNGADAITLADAMNYFQKIHRAEIKQFGSESELMRFYSDVTQPMQSRIHTTPNIIAALKTMSQCDGCCDLSESKLIVAFEYMLYHDATAFSYHNEKFRFSRSEILLLTATPLSDFQGRKAEEAVKQFQERFLAIGYQLVHIPMVMKLFGSYGENLENEINLRRILDFVYPRISYDIGLDNSEEKFDKFRQALRQISAPLFTQEVFTGIAEIPSDRPFMLIKLATSRIRTKNKKMQSYADFLCIPVKDGIRNDSPYKENDFAALFNAYSHSILELTQHTNASFRLDFTPTLDIKGIHKTILDFAIHMSVKRIDSITADLNNSKIYFGKFLPPQKTDISKVILYLMVAIASELAEGLYVDAPTPKLKKLYYDIFSHIDKNRKTQKRVVTFSDPEISGLRTILNGEPLAKGSNSDQYLPQFSQMGNERILILEKSTLGMIHIRFNRYNPNSKSETVTYSLKEYIDYLDKEIHIKTSFKDTKAYTPNVKCRGKKP